MPKNNTPDKALVERLRDVSGWLSAHYDDEAEEHGCAIDDAIAAISQPQHGGLVEAGEYLIDLLEKAVAGKPIRDMAEAIGAFRHAAALSNSPVVGEDADELERAGQFASWREAKRRMLDVTLPLVRPIPADTADLMDTIASFQDRVRPWMMECFGAEIAADLVERTDRATEEMLELSQAICAKIGVDFAPRAHALVDYVAGRPVGEPAQEVGGVMVTLAALCLAAGLDMHDAGEVELARIMQPETVKKIRAKQAAKPTGSALPIASNSPVVVEDALPNDDDEGPCTDCYDTGVTIQTERRCACQPTPTDTADRKEMPDAVNDLILGSMGKDFERKYELNDTADRREAVARAVYEAWGCCADANAAGQYVADRLASPIAVPDRRLKYLEDEARRFAEFYPEASDARNTFLIFAEKIAMSAAATGEA